MTALLLLVLTTASAQATPDARLLAPLPPGGAAQPDAVLRWNTVLLETIRAERTPPPVAARNLAIMHVAVYDTVNAIYRSHQIYHTDVVPVAGASAEAAASAAAHRVLVALYPRQRAALDRPLAADLVAFPAGVGRDNSVDLGRFVADRILAWRAQDGAETSARYTPRLEVGRWRPTPEAYRPALLPGWGQLTPFAMRPRTQQRPPGPPALTSAAYAAAFREVKAVGDRNSVVRTAEQTEIAWFWSDDAGTVTPPGHWNQIAQTVARARGTSLAENARLFAVLNVSLADGAILCWLCKFDHEFWRPVTAIRADADPTWTPLLSTPPFPSYTSGHSLFSAAAATALAEIVGSDTVSFTTTSDGLPGVTRSFTSFSAAAAEAGQSRIYGGIHWQFDNVDGQATGRALGRYVARYFFLQRRPGVPPGPLAPTKGRELVGPPGGGDRIEVGYPPGFP